VAPTAPKLSSLVVVRLPTSDRRWRGGSGELVRPGEEERKGGGDKKRGTGRGGTRFRPASSVREWRGSGCPVRVSIVVG
jgi:hypothetical protein